jgi:hypothetical protein
LFFLLTVGSLKVQVVSRAYDTVCERKSNPYALSLCQNYTVRADTETHFLRRSWVTFRNFREEICLLVSFFNFLAVLGIEPRLCTCQASILPHSYIPNPLLYLKMPAAKCMKKMNRCKAFGTPQSPALL